MTNDNLPPLDEDELSERLKTALDWLEQVDRGISRIIVHLDDVQSEIILRRLNREKDV